MWAQWPSASNPLDRVVTYAASWANWDSSDAEKAAAAGGRPADVKAAAVAASATAAAPGRDFRHRLPHERRLLLGRLKKSPSTTAHCVQKSNYFKDYSFKH